MSRLTCAPRHVLAGGSDGLLTDLICTFKLTVLAAGAVPVTEGHRKQYQAQILIATVTLRKPQFSIREF